MADNGQDKQQLADLWFGALATASTIGVYRTEFGHGVVWANDRFTEIFGVRRDAVMGNRWLDVVHRDDQPRLVELLDAARAEPRPLEVEFRVVRPRREPRLVRARAVPVRAGGEVIGFAGAVEDRTEAVEAESALYQVNEALRQSNETFATVFENAPLALYALDGEGVVQLWNPACEATFGFTEHEAIGRFSPVVRDVDLEAAADVRRRVMSGETIPPMEVRCRHRDGHEIDAMFAATPMRDTNGEVDSVLVFSSDITSEKARERALLESEARFRALAEHASVIITILGADGTLRYSSPSTARILGYPDGAGTGVNVFSSLHPDDRDRVWELFQQLIADSEATTTARFRLADADGRWRELEAVGNNLLHDPAVNGILITARDVTGQAAAEARLAESEARYRGIVEDQTELICRFDRDGTLTFVNEAFARYFSRPVDDLVGTRLIPFIPDEDHERLRGALESLGPDNLSVSVDIRILRPEGAIRWHSWTYRVVLDAEGGVVEYGALGRDITEQRDAEALVRDQARVLEMIALGAPLPETLEGLCRIVEEHAPDVVCSVLLVDEHAPGQLRCGAAPSLPPSFVEHLDGVPIGPRVGSCGTAAYLGEPVVVTDVETDPLWSDHRQVPLAHGLRGAWSHPIKAASNNQVVGTFCLYSQEPGAPTKRHEQLLEIVVHHAAIAIERKRFESQLAHQAHHDPLTELPNRVLFMEFLVHALARARRYRSTVAVLFLDLDRFKVINDSLGHDVGDEVLVALSERLRSVLRPGDTIARFGGDEFTILCEDLSGPQAKQQVVEVAERLLDVIHQPFLLEGEEHFVSASVGIALAASGEDRPDALLRGADAAMYRAKERGKGRWELFDESMRQTALRRLEIENSLHRAIDRGEFRVFYQPCMSIREGSCVGAEALVRWQHPERGLVAPSEFIGLAEETGLVVPLGQWVLEDACRHASRWRSERLDTGFFQVSVNLSGRQLVHPDLVEQVASVIDRTGVDPALVCLEITESVLMEDVDATITTLTKLKELGIGLSIDDFGTGYSSLGYLKRFPVDFVKVDQSFVAGLGTDTEDSAIVAAVVSLGHALGLQVVAEGVETDLQLAELRELGCDQAQGYLFAPPQPALGLQDLMTRPGRWQPEARLR